MTYGTIADIYTKIRRLTGSGNSLQLTNQMMQDYIDSFYFFDFPAQFRSGKLKDKYVFNTIQGQDTYAFDSEKYTTVEMPCYVQKTLIQLFQDPGSFYGCWGYNLGAGTQFVDNFVKRHADKFKEIGNEGYLRSAVKEYIRANDRYDKLFASGSTTRPGLDASRNGDRRRKCLRKKPGRC